MGFFSWMYVGQDHKLFKKMLLLLYEKKRKRKKLKKKSKSYKTVVIQDGAFYWPHRTQQGKPYQDVRKLI